MSSCLCYAPGYILNVHVLTVMHSTTSLEAAIGI